MPQAVLSASPVAFRVNVAVSVRVNLLDPAAALGDFSFGLVQLGLFERFVVFFEDDKRLLRQRVQRRIVPLAGKVRTVHVLQRERRRRPTKQAIGRPGSAGIRPKSSNQSTPVSSGS